LKYDVIVIGGGTTGVFTCLDLALRGVTVALLERNEMGSGTSSKSHGMLHSGARYAVNDPHAAVECAEENQVLSKIAHHLISDTSGLFVAVSAEDAEYQRELVDGCRKCNVPCSEVPREWVRAMEPKLNPSVKCALEVPDKVIRGHDLIFCASLTASMNGAKFYTNREVTGFSKRDGKTVDGVRAYNRTRGQSESFESDLTINAAGPWAGRVARLAGLPVEDISFAGGMGVVPAKLCYRVINRMRPPSDGDIVIPYVDNYSIVGTTAKLVDDVEKVELSEEELDLLMDEGSQMFPGLRDLGFRRTFASVRPLLRVGEETGAEARKVSRSYEIFDHGLDGIEGLITISGGKLTTCRLMGEQIADLAAKKLGVTQPSTTKDTPLLGATPEKDAAEISKAAHIDYGLVKRIMSTVGTIDEERFMPVIRLLMSYAFSEAK
jgi:glycerol-3-phosphate dehydrogenase